MSWDVRAALRTLSQFTRFNGIMAVALTRTSLRMPSLGYGHDTSSRHKLESENKNTKSISLSTQAQNYRTCLWRPSMARLTRTPRRSSDFSRSEVLLSTRNQSVSRQFLIFQPRSHTNPSHSLASLLKQFGDRQEPPPRQRSRQMCRSLRCELGIVSKTRFNVKKDCHIAWRIRPTAPCGRSSTKRTGRLYSRRLPETRVHRRRTPGSQLFPLDSP
jgi:hypothetical protein